MQKMYRGSKLLLILEFALIIMIESKGRVAFYVSRSFNVN